MKFIYGLLALAASIVATNAQYCTIGVCVKEGENCNINNYNFTDNSVVDITCEYGTFCPTSSVIFTPVCTKLSGLGETCGTPFTECAEPFSCRSVATSKGNLQTCAMPGYLGFGESCNSDYQCGNGLTCNEEICSLKPHVICGNDGQCPFGQFCNATDSLNTPVQCRTLYATGQKCTRDGQCAYNNYCGAKQGDTSGDLFCQSNFNKVQGDACAVHGASAFVQLASGFRYECAASLTCQAGTCQSPQNSIPTGDCMDVANACPSAYYSTCQCTSTSQVKTGKCSASPFNLGSNCQTSAQNLASCAIEHECPSVESIELGPDSCLMKHCRSEICDNNNCVVQTNTCGDVPVYPVCNTPSSSSVVLPSFILLIVAIIALLF
ncbi:hypothetical protein ACTFIW_009780 [Dictyostelium discoideum]